MPFDLSSVALPLFVPADRPDRFAKAFGSGADTVILDLEDAVAPENRAGARMVLRKASATISAASCNVLVRINAWNATDHAADLEAVAGLPLAGIVLAKAERSTDVEDVAATTGKPVVALVESAVGLANARGIATTAARIAFGSFDFAADLGCRHVREALLLARLELVLASRLAGRPGPIDGVTAAVGDAKAIEADALYAAGLGFAGKLLIHPAQVSPAQRGFAPSAAELAWARRVMSVATDGGAVRLDGEMVDAPVRLRAASVLRRANSSETGELR